VVRQWRDSQFCQDYILEIDSPILKIVNRVDWRETHVLVKVAFPLTVANDFATYEIACGAINRSHQEQEKWEVYGKNWADLSDKSGNYGVSLLNNCKYGYDAQSNQLRLTLLRGATWPDEKADIGSHQFTYALYPHSQTWQAAKTVHKGYELNIPLEVVILDNHKPISGCLPFKASWISLGSQDLILMALKRSQEHPQEWILRCYESQGQGTELELTSDLGLKLGQSVDLLERPTTEGQDIEPWKIRSFNLRGRQKDHLTPPPEDRTPYR
jgi:alpha-mannosidase